LILVRENNLGAERETVALAVESRYRRQMLQQIRLYLKAAPFKAFEIHCSSGEILRVEHPENAAIVHQVVVALPDGENAVMLSPLHISGVSGSDAVAA
jgi:hypothetical protein